jgi:hypothetical protein
MPLRERFPKGHLGIHDKSPTDEHSWLALISIAAVIAISVRVNFAQRTEEAVLVWEDRACSLRQHRTSHTLVRQAGGVVACARHLLG